LQQVRLCLDECCSRYSCASTSVAAGTPLSCEQVTSLRRSLLCELMKVIEICRLIVGADCSQTPGYGGGTGKSRGTCFSCGNVCCSLIAVQFLVEHYYVTFGL